MYRNGQIILIIPVPSKGTNFNSVKKPVNSTQSSVAIFDEHWYQEIFAKLVQRNRKCVEIMGGISLNGKRYGSQIFAYRKPMSFFVNKR